MWQVESPTSATPILQKRKGEEGTYVHRLLNIHCMPARRCARTLKFEDRLKVFYRVALDVNPRFNLENWKALKRVKI